MSTFAKTVQRTSVVPVKNTSTGCCRTGPVRRSTKIGQGLWTKVKQMTAFGLGKLWSDGSIDLIERVRVVQSDTLSLIQGGYTAGSTTSEASCEAVRLACNILFERLAPLRERLQEKMGEVSWDALILQASLQSVNLSASTYWVPDSSSRSYLNYGAATSEVKIDPA
ncbi:Indole-3-acetaldehyde oxidase [Acorus calamus]|uniref:Indole-3-acetaldehyde oxidase n=1 Tax=Acorus calamus TaxID=4465 RepID=A0AAV9BZ19_ACOCL|nr:Indole-3-acetaldehyde oxidase [Acorus calamus]